MYASYTLANEIIVLVVSDNGQHLKALTLVESEATGRLLQLFNQFF